MTPKLSINQWFILLALYSHLSITAILRGMSMQEVQLTAPTLADQMVLAELGYINDPEGKWIITEKGRELVETKKQL